MPVLKDLFKQDQDPLALGKNYLSYVGDLLNKVEMEPFGEMLEVLQRARVDGQVVYVAGNGGSAATANHFSNDLIWGTRGKALPRMASLSLAANGSSITALGNDMGYEFIFSEQMESLFKKGDVLFSISASGNSPNILRAAHVAKEKGGKNLGLSGFDGGKLDEVADHCLVVKTEKGEYAPVEDVHSTLCHLFTLSLHAKANP